MLFIIIYILILIASAVFEKVRFKAHITPMIFFCDVWCIVGIFSNIALNDYYKPSDYVNIVIIVGILMVFGLWLIVKNPKQLVNQLQSNSFSMNYSVALLVFIELLIFLLILPKLKYSINILSTYNMAVLRSPGDYGVGRDLGYTAYFVTVLARPFYALISVMMAVSLFVDIQRNKRNWLIVFTIVNLIIYTIATAGRELIVNTIFYIFIAALLFSRGRIIQFINRRKKIIIPIAILVIGLLYMQKQRSPNLNIIDTLYMYYFSGPSYLTQILEFNKDIFVIDKNYLLGQATFGFITNIVSYLLIIITGVPQGSLYLVGSRLTWYPISVGAHTRLNAMCTCFYDFLLDWGTAGIIIGPIVLSILSIYIYKLTAKKHDWYHYVVLLYFINVLIRTVFKWELIGVEFSVILFYLFIFYKTNHIKIVLGGRKHPCGKL